MYAVLKSVLPMVFMDIRHIQTMNKWEEIK